MIRESIEVQGETFTTTHKEIDMRTIITSLVTDCERSNYFYFILRMAAYDLATAKRPTLKVIYDVCQSSNLPAMLNALEVFRWLEKRGYVQSIQQVVTYKAGDRFMYTGTLDSLDGAVFRVIHYDGQHALGYIDVDGKIVTAHGFRYVDDDKAIRLNELTSHPERFKKLSACDG